MIKKACYTFIVIFMALIMFLLGACSPAGNPNPPTGSPDTSPSPTDPSPTEPTPTEPVGYQYGSNWADQYDASYMAELESMDGQQFTISQLSGVDSVGRRVSTVGTNKESKYVGIFYFLWLGSWGNGVYDISKMLEANPGLKYDTDKNPLWVNSDSPYYNGSISPQNAFHYFEEPFYGYYNSHDPWVIKRHLELLSFAGIDFLYLDFTNAFVDTAVKNASNIYPQQTYALMDAILQMQALGYKVPQIVPIVCNNVTSGGTPTISRVVQWVYENYYEKDNFKYKSCWFTADNTRNPSGKPLLVAYDFNPAHVTNPAAKDAFWIRNVVWPTAVTPSSYTNGFPWMDYELPQKNYDGIMNVSVVQHLGGSWSSEAYLARQRKNTGYKYRGRSASFSQEFAYESDSVEEALLGKNFSDQWYNVFNYGGSDEVWMVTVTGWNEWVAQKLNIHGQYATFVDSFDIAFSRDVEMMRDEHGYGDNFYLQLVDNVRKFKYGTSDKNSNTAMWQRVTLDHKDISAWDTVTAKYWDFVSDAMNRDFNSAGNVYRYKDNTARNDIEYLKIANDSEYLYILVATSGNITQYSEGDTGWMNIYLSTGKAGGWENYNYLINRYPDITQGTTSIEKLSTSGKSIATQTLTATADYHMEGKFISYRVPLETLGITSADEIGVKACDNIFASSDSEKNDGLGVFSFGDVMAFYYGGDSAPIGRLNYSYRLGY